MDARTNAAGAMPQPMSVCLTLMMLLCFVTLSSCKTTLFPPDAKLPDGSVYHGDIEDGLFDGEGIQEFPDGTVYRGEFSRGYWEGQGELIRKDSWRYEGQFVRGSFSGEGELETKWEHYEGEFDNDQYNGIGEWSDKSGNQYSGGFKDGEFSGHGTYTYVDGTVLEAEFRNGSPQAGVEKGEYGVYHGDFKEWLYDGVGQYTTSTGEVYKGDFAGGEFTGKGMHVSGDEVYQGEFVEWNYHGKGYLVRTDGSGISANFKGGRAEGEGVLLTLENGKVKTRTKGEWINGVFVRPGEMTPKEKREELVQTMLDSDAQRLALAIDALEDERPGERDVYFVAVGGDGYEDVFKRDIDVAETGVRKIFDVGGRTLHLLNNKAYERYPLATTTSIETALRAVDEKMNPQEDVLFIHMVSHGGKSGAFSLQQPGIALPDIGAREFSEVLKKLKVRYKVLVVSACFSGQWLDEMKGSDIVILASARRDRTSFGCGDDSEMTWFTKAVYRESQITLGDTDKWFENVDSLIRKWEVEQDFSEKQYSYPQFYAGENFVRWWGQ